MEKDLLLFNKHIQFVENGKIATYEDEKGNYFTVALAPKYQHVAQLLLNCEYIEADAVQMKSLQYNGDIDKDMVFQKETVSRKTVKYEITKNEKDKNIIVDSDVEISKVWIVRNGFKLSKAFATKDEALALCIKTNQEIFDSIVE